MLASTLWLTACGALTEGATAPAPEETVLQLKLEGCRHGVGNRATAVSMGSGLAMTVAHAFDDVESFTVLDPDGTEFTADIVHLDRDRDIAVLSFSNEERAAGVQEGLVFGPATEDTSVRLALHPEDGPWVQDVEILRRVKVSLDGVGRRDGIELSGNIQPGDSGGPVLDDEGRVIGLVFASSRGDDRGWAVASTDLASALDDIGPPIEIDCDPVD